MSKGTTNERKTAGCFATAGYRTWRSEESRYGNNDIFMLFDIAALRDETLELVQVKTNRAQGINDWFMRARPFAAVSGVRIGYVVRHDREGYRLARPTDDPTDGYEWTVDTRDSDGNIGEAFTTALQE